MTMRPILTKHKKYRQGFTIVELLIVIVVIAILAVFTLVAYNGISARADTAALASDLSSSAKKIELYKTTSTGETYPATLEVAGITPSSHTTYQYTVDNGSTPHTFCLTGKSGAIYYHTSSTDPHPSSGVCVGHSDGSEPPTCDDTDQLGVYPDCYDEFSASPIVGQVNFASIYGYTGMQPTRCPTGFVPVPGSTLYGKPNGFCAMKYEAKQSSSTVPVSQASGLPWVSVTQLDSKTYSQNVAGCTGCHLITESEWMTIAQNMVIQDYNWTGGTFNSGQLFIGHTDSSPSAALAASSNDNDGYSGTGQTTGAQRRTMRLSNGEILWDMSGNHHEWTNEMGTVQIGPSSVAFREWTAITNGNLLTPNPVPGYGNPAISTFTSTKGMGQIYSGSSVTSMVSSIRGGKSTYGSKAGIFSIIQGNAPAGSDTTITFRVTQ